MARPCTIHDTGASWKISTRQCNAAPSTCLLHDTKLSMTLMFGHRSPALVDRRPSSYFAWKVTTMVLCGTDIQIQDMPIERSRGNGINNYDICIRYISNHVHSVSKWRLYSCHRNNIGVQNRRLFSSLMYTSHKARENKERWSMSWTERVGEKESW
jgi:hypothetical protein